MREPEIMNFPRHGGIQVIVNDVACVSRKWKQYRFPKSKKKRIRKKWAKNNKYFRMQDVHSAINFDGKLIVSSKMYEKMKTLIPER